MLLTKNSTVSMCDFYNSKKACWNEYSIFTSMFRAFVRNKLSKELKL